MVIGEASQCLPFWFRSKILTILEKENVVIVKFFFWDKFEGVWVVKWITVFINKADSDSDLAFHAKTQTGKDCQDCVLLACTAISREGLMWLGNLLSKEKTPGGMVLSL